MSSVLRLVLTPLQLDGAASRIQQIQTLASDLSLTLQIETVAKPTSKYLNQLQQAYPLERFLLLEKEQVLIFHQGMKIGAQWHSLQRRVVGAGRKSELLLQSGKLQAQMFAVDTTAGFGHDSLILASTGAQVLMLEQHPLMVLLLKSEHQRLQQDEHWHKLLSRLHIVHAQSQMYLQYLLEKQQKVDLVYLDPMFPDGSYDGVKVGKHMQLLHDMASPPSLDDERHWLDLATRLVQPSQGRVIVKRPSQAAMFANQPPTKSWQNDVIRFDGYF